MVQATYVRGVNGFDPTFDIAPAAVPSWFRVARQDARAHSATTGLFVGLVVLNLIDLVTTRLVLDRGGQECNPVMAPIIDYAFGALWVKALCLGLIGTLIARSRRSTRTLVALVAVDVWYVVVIGWNLRVLHLVN